MIKKFSKILFVFSEFSDKYALHILQDPPNQVVQMTIDIHKNYSANKNGFPEPHQGVFKSSNRPDQPGDSEPDLQVGLPEIQPTGRKFIPGVATRRSDSVDIRHRSTAQDSYAS